MSSVRNKTNNNLTSHLVDATQLTEVRLFHLRCNTCVEIGIKNAMHMITGEVGYYTEKGRGENTESTITVTNSAT